MSNNGLLCMCVGIYLVIVRVKTGAVLSLIVTDHINIDYCKGRKHQAKTFLRWCQKKKNKSVQMNWQSKHLRCQKGLWELEKTILIFVMVKILENNSTQISKGNLKLTDTSYQN